MKNREIKFRAWIPDLSIMLDNITLYGSGMMGYDYDKFQSYIDGLPKHIQFIEDGIYHSDEDHFDLLLTVLPGEDWIWIEENNFIPMEFTGIKDINGVDIYEGYILRARYAPSYKLNKFEVKWNNSSASFVCYRKHENSKVQFEQLPFCPSNSMEDLEVIGNIHENPELC
jgi:uncharacterized phage protein (TIGR01671 family)